MTSTEKFYHDVKTLSPRYLFNLIPTAKKAYITRNDNKLPHFKVKHLKHLFQKFIFSFQL